MSFVDLPEEIIIIIIKHLDMMSLNNLYTACDRVRDIISMYGIIKTCNMSLNIMATVQTLKLDFFKNISKQLQELNMSGIVDLSKNLLLPAMSRLKHLNVLNVSYTNINVLDIIDIYELCPTIKNISVNFVFGKSMQIRLLKKQLLQCQDVFKNFECVHFVGNLTNLIYSQLGPFILQKARLKTLKYSITECEMTPYENEECEDMINFDYFAVYLLYSRNSNVYYGFMQEMYLFNMLDFSKYEVIIIVRPNLQLFAVYASVIFTDFLNDNFHVRAETLTDFSISLSGNVCVMLWNKSSTTFDDKFFTQLLNKLKQLFPCNFTTGKMPLASKNDWYYTTPKELTVPQQYELCDTGFKKKRLALSNLVLNYDEEFADKNELQLSLQFDGQMKSAVTLSVNSTYLRKLTYLSLNGTVRYSTEFFNILFRCCENLVTLVVEAPSLCSCLSSISRSLPLNRNIKNLRLVDRRIDFKTLFSSMSQCKTLENVNICDMSSDTFDLSDPLTMFKKCENLYCLYVYGPVSTTNRTKKMQILKRAKLKCQKLHLNVNVFINTQMAYDPYIDVFNLNPIKPI
ncbi:uncharacterized protein LOC116778594 [Danaus plexippus]|uniref:uncharacterized protein LOC116778594 n=1 Tax=Danaus plexippus TaxID=13037 RepID=UPI002AB1F6D8|nr:uncharacterized protein LOC116778594 [Danaus plexippus]